jgi:hypothetical protein
MAMKYIDIDEKVNYTPNDELMHVKVAVSPHDIAYKEESNDRQAEITIDELHDSE